MFYCCHLCGCCKPVSGHTVRGKSEGVAATNPGALKNPEMVNLFLVQTHLYCSEIGP